MANHWYKLSLRGFANSAPPWRMSAADFAAFRDAVGAVDRILLLIHGYNVDQKGGEADYDELLEYAQYYGPVPSNSPARTKARQFVGVLWPGDCGPTAYGESVQRAVNSVDALADALARLATPERRLRLEVIAHSMGCRLTLLTLDALRAQSNIAVERVMFMAGAVPTYRLEPGAGNGDMRRGLDHVSRPASSQTIGSMYSDGDWILRFFFPYFESRQPEPHPKEIVALGRTRWKGAAPPNMGQIDMDPTGHISYWDSWRAAAVHYKFMDLGESGNTVAQVPQPPSRATEPPREVPSYLSDVPMYG